jgi:hypothetical protein
MRKPETGFESEILEFERSKTSVSMTETSARYIVLCVGKNDCL